MLYEWPCHWLTSSFAIAIVPMQENLFVWYWYILHECGAYTYQQSPYGVQNGSNEHTYSLKRTSFFSAASFYNHVHVKKNMKLIHVGSDIERRRHQMHVLAARACNGDDRLLLSDFFFLAMYSPSLGAQKQIIMYTCMFFSSFAKLLACINWKR